MKRQHHHLPFLQWRLFLGCLLLFTSTLPVTATSSLDSPIYASHSWPIMSMTRGGSSSSNRKALTAQKEADQRRIDCVKTTLQQRLQYIQEGRRMQDVRQWIEERGGDAMVLSMHGLETDVDYESTFHNHQQQPDSDVFDCRDCDDDDDDDDNNSKALTTQIIQKIPLVPSAKETQDPFPANRLDLDLPNCETTATALNVVEDNYKPNPLQLALRACRLSIKFTPILSSLWLAVCSQKFRQNVWYPWVASTLGTTSAAFIKWGQWAATRTDMFPDALCQSLEQLQSDAPAHSWSYSQKMIESSLGLPPDSLHQVFDEFQKQPLASGSIAQVYKAHLGQTPIALKIRHPKVALLIDMDFRLMALLAKLFDYIPALSWLHLRESVSQFSHTMAAQAHLQVEAHHLEILNYNFEKWKSVQFPKPLYASSAVILETFEPGAIVSDMLDAYDQVYLEKKMTQPMVVEELDDEDDQENERKGGNKKRLVRGGTTDAPATTSSSGTHNDLSVTDLIPVDIAKFIVTTGVGIYLKMLLVDNLMHADLHPGNIMLAAIEKGQSLDTGHDMDLLVVRNNTDNNSLKKNAMTLANTLYRVCLVDAGMVAQLTEDESSNFVGLLASLGEGDGHLAAKFALRFSVENNMSEEEKAAFGEEMQELFDRDCRGYGTNVDVGEVLRGVLGLIRKHQVRIDANYATLVVNCLCVQSLALRVCPDYNVLEAGKPLLRSYFSTFYEPDGTPKPRQKAIRRFKRIMPFRYLQKTRRDDAFFRRIKQDRRKRGIQRS